MCLCLFMCSCVCARGWKMSGRRRRSQKCHWARWERARRGCGDKRLRCPLIVSWGRQAFDWIVGIRRRLLVESDVTAPRLVRPVNQKVAATSYPHLKKHRHASLHQCSINVQCSTSVMSDIWCWVRVAFTLRLRVSAFIFVVVVLSASIIKSNADTGRVYRMKPFLLNTSGKSVMVILLLEMNFF